MRFAVVIRTDGRVGVLDRQGEKFAHFMSASDEVWSARERADRAARRLNDGTDTTTGYIWEKA